ncbi:MAG: YfbM family protein [Bacteroidota bacterium]
MIGNLLRVSKNELEEYLEDSTLFEQRIYPEEEDHEGDDIEDENLLDIDKAWEGIFYLLTGFNLAEAENATPPLSWSFFSGQILDEEQDVGYGPANYCLPEQVKEVALALKNMPSNELKKNYDAVKMDELEIYPFGWAADTDGGFEYLSHHYECLRDFFEVAAKNDQAVITFLN